MKKAFVVRDIVPGEAPGQVKGVFFDLLNTAHGQMIHAARPGLAVCLPLDYSESPVPGLGTVPPSIALAGGRISASMFELMRPLAWTQGAPFREALFHMRLMHLDGSGAPHWSMPAQRRSYGAVLPNDRDVTDVIAALHTHPSGCRGFSKVDDADDYGFTLELVVEGIEATTPHVAARVAVYGRHIRVPARAVAELPASWLTDPVAPHLMDLVCKVTDAAGGRDGTFQ